MIAHLERCGIRSTPNRLLVLKELRNATCPISLADLEISLDTMDKASIFRVLELFTEKELVHVIQDGSRSQKYELCHGGPHHNISDQHIHFYCEKCEKTICLDDISIPDILLPEGYLSRTANFLIRGVCAKCNPK